MNVQEGKRFNRSFFGYNRSAVDAEFNRLISQADAMLGERENLQSQINVLNEDKNYLSREQARLNTSLSTSTSQIVELESTISRAKVENESLQRSVDAQKAENNALQLRCEQLRERDRDFAMREREFTELQSSVSSIMSVAKRATDRLFQKAVDNQESVTQIAGDAAREVAAIRADMSHVRDQLNEALDQIQDRIDRVDASLTGAVHKLVAIKHNDGLQIGDKRPDILDEVERLLNMRAGESDGGFTVPSLGPYSAKFVADTAQRVADGRITPRAVPSEGVEIKSVRPVLPGYFNSTEQSILESNKLLERGGVTAEEYYGNNPQFLPGNADAADGSESYPPTEDADAPQNDGVNVQPSWQTVDSRKPEPPAAQPENDGAIPMPPPPQPMPQRIGFQTSYDDGQQFETQSGDGDFWDNEPNEDDGFFQPQPVIQTPDGGNNGGFWNRGGTDAVSSGMYIGNHQQNASGGYECYPVRSYSFTPYVEPQPEQAEQPAAMVRPRVCRGTNGGKRVSVRPVVRRR